MTLNFTHFKLTKIISVIRNIICFSDIEKSFLCAFSYLHIHDIKGDYLEFGTYKGESLISVYRINEKYNLIKTFYCFDSFNGLPNGICRWEKNQFRVKEVEFYQNLKNNNINQDKIVLYKNNFDISLLNFKPSSIALVFLDCDLYKSATCVMKFLSKYQHFILVVDDFYPELYRLDYKNYVEIAQISYTKKVFFKNAR